MKYEDEIKYWVWLTCIPQVGLVTRNRLLAYFGSPFKIYQAGQDMLETVPGVTEGKVRSILSCRSLDEAKRIIHNCRINNMNILTKEHDILKRIACLGDSAPVILYSKGIINRIDCSVGIVGARRCTQEIKYKTARLASEYVNQGYTIVSGMAKGVDAYAQTACINAGGYTIAVLGNGLDICYPKEHIRLMECISNSGLLLSEYAPGVRPSQYHFPQRNRLISALSDRLIVLPAGEKSGALITAEYAKKIGREVEYA